MKNLLKKIWQSDKKVGIVGRWEIIQTIAKTKEEKLLNNKIGTMKKKGLDFSKELSLLQEMCGKKEVFHNLVPDVYLNLLAKACGGSVAAGHVDSTVMTYGALGTGNTAFTGSSTGLNTEAYREVISGSSIVGNVKYTSFFLSNSEGNGLTFKEASLFAGNASITADSGTPATLLLLTPDFVKDSSKTLTLNVSHTFLSA